MLISYLLKRAGEGKPTDRLSMFIASREGAKDLTTQRMIVSILLIYKAIFKV